MYIGNFDENISEEDLLELFDLKSTKYLQDACKVEVIKNERSRRSRNVSKKLLKLTGETFKKGPLTIKEAKKLPNLTVQSPTKTHSAVVINHHPENQTTFQNKRTGQNNLPTVSGKQTYRNAAIQKPKLPAKTLILSDSTARGIRIYEFNKYIKYDRANLLTFPGATSRHLLHCLDIHLEDNQTKIVIIHVDVNDKMIIANQILKSILAMWKKWYKNVVITELRKYL